jgi:glycine/D-amino acid oxidase-like deaminating enzyme
MVVSGAGVAGAATPRARTQAGAPVTVLEAKESGRLAGDDGRDGPLASEDPEGAVALSVQAAVEHEAARTG